MQSNVLGLIFAENSEVNLSELTSFRSLAAVPVGGRYRIIDFVLSNMVNSGIINVGITTKDNTQSLYDHLGTGKDWDLARKANGLFVLHPDNNGERVQGGIDTINGIISYLKKSAQEYVIVCDCNTICNIRFDDVVSFHVEKDADITMIYTHVNKLTSKDLANHILIEADDETAEVKDIQIYPAIQKTNCSYMHIFIIKKGLLMDLVKDCVPHSEHKILKNLLLGNLPRYRIFAYEFNGYSKRVNNIQTYFELNLELLIKDVRDELFGVGENSIYTKVKDTVPTKYDKSSDVCNSFIADGCIIEGNVRNSVIFRGVHIGKGACVDNCVIMQNSDIMDSCLVENAIFDKEVVLRSGKKLVGQQTYPMVIGKRTIV